MNYYETLNILETASQEEIKSAYRRLAMKHHPDKNSGDKTSEEQFKKINEAYMTLSDTKKRASYDQSLKFKNSHSNAQWSHQGNTNNQNPFNDESFEDIFNYFRDSQRKSSEYRTYEYSKNSTPTVSLSLKFWEAIFGCVKKIKIPAKVLPGNLQANITIEPGIEHGATLQVTIKNKIFYVKVNVKEDKLFKRKGLDLYTTFDVPLTTSILGGSIIFPHWTKEVEVTIPPETSQGQTFRIKQMGISKKGQVGDIYLSINIVPPQRLTKRQKELMEEFKKLEKQKDSNSYKNLQKLWQYNRV